MSQQHTVRERSGRSRNAVSPGPNFVPVSPIPTRPSRTRHVVVSRFTLFSTVDSTRFSPEIRRVKSVAHRRARGSYFGSRWRGGGRLRGPVARGRFGADRPDVTANSALRRRRERLFFSFS